MARIMILRPDRSASNELTFSIIAQGKTQAFIPLPGVTATFQRPGEASLSGPVIAGPHRFFAACQIRANGPVAVRPVANNTLGQSDVYLPSLTEKLVPISQECVTRLGAGGGVPAAPDLQQERRLSLRQTQRLARAQTGQTMAAGRMLSRLQAARRDVLAGTRSLVAIALQYGFFDQAHFTSAYRLWSGITPKADRVRGCSHVAFLQDQFGWSPIPDRLIEFGEDDGLWL